jgi:hypothetical protein
VLVVLISANSRFSCFFKQKKQICSFPDAEQFRLRVFVGGGILVFSVRMGLFGGWGPLRRGRVGMLRLVAFLFVEEFIEEPMHGGRSGGTTGIAGGK